MFTGIVTAIGTIREARQQGDLRLVIAAPFDPAGIAIGASIACSGVCLTVVDRAGVNGDAWFAVDHGDRTDRVGVVEEFAQSDYGKVELAYRLDQRGCFDFGFFHRLGSYQ